jgi:hypothetical protein
MGGTSTRTMMTTKVRSSLCNKQCASDLTCLNAFTADDDQFDEVLDRKVWSLSAQRLKWDLEIANKRRTMPKDVELLMQQLKEQRDEQERELFRLTNEPIEEDEEMEEGM